jgi:hypothetical protein
MAEQRSLSGHSSGSLYGTRAQFHHFLFFFAITKLYFNPNPSKETKEEIMITATSYEFFVEHTICFLVSN